MIGSTKDKKVEAMKVKKKKSQTRKVDLIAKKVSTVKVRKENQIKIDNK
jgi:hypothetical protein